jgi:hypothetical protein
MIEKAQVVPMILEAVPTFQRTWDECENQDLHYAVIGDLARHLLELHESGQTEQFGALCEVIEAFHTDGSAYVRELATIGILEGIQNVWGHTDTSPEEFCRSIALR